MMSHGDEILDPPEDLVAKEHNHQVALRLAGLGLGTVSSFAKLWLDAYRKDPTVPVFGVRPYWTPTGQNGLPELFLPLAVWGVEERVDFAGRAEANDLQFILNDPHPRVRKVARDRAKFLGINVSVAPK